jgi:uncharacterized cupredoxin-like copper-binding protein
LKKLIILTASAFLLSTAAYAAGSHSGGHDEVKKEEAHGHGAKKDDHHADGGDDHHGDMAVGEPGKKEEVSQTVTITMKETDDGDMVFEPKSVNVVKGQTVLFTVKNVGELVHEFVLDDHKSVMKHKALMEKFPDMEHDDPNAVTLEPGKTGEVFWKFSNSGTFEFACLIPGHYDSGMKGGLTVVEKAANN